MKKICPVAMPLVRIHRPVVVPWPIGGPLRQPTSVYDNSRLYLTLSVYLNLTAIPDGTGRHRVKGPVNEDVVRGRGVGTALDPIHVHCPPERRRTDAPLGHPQPLHALNTPDRRGRN